MGRPPTQPLPEEDELLWDDGTAYPETCLDEFPLVTKYQALSYLGAGLFTFYLIGSAAQYRNKTVKPPYAPKQFPYDNLKVELGSHS